MQMLWWVGDLLGGGLVDEGVGGIIMNYYIWRTISTQSLTILLLDLAILHFVI